MMLWSRPRKGTSDKLTEAPQRGWLIKRFDRSVDDRKSFDCGKAPLNDWIKRRASQHEKRDLARTYVAVDRETSAVLGYYALSSHRVRYDSLPSDQSKGLPRTDIPVVLLGKLAVDRTAQGQGLGALLLLDALCRSERLASQIGIRAVEVHAIDARARSFYLKYGFTSLEDDPHHLFLPMHIIRRLGLQSADSEEKK